MVNIFYIILLFQMIHFISCLISHTSSISRTSRFTLSMSSLTLYGSQQTRSPLVNWYLYEQNVPFIQKPPRPSDHPFQQVPFLTDDNGKVEVFESGAILLYLLDAYGLPQSQNSAQERAKYTKWVLWANAELDSLCFGSGMSGTKLDKASKPLDILDNILSKNEWIVEDKFSVADVAIGSYLNYVPIFFRDVKPTQRPNILRYMKACAQREAFIKAFGSEHSDLVIQKSSQWLSESGQDKKSNFFSKIF